MDIVVGGATALYESSGGGLDGDGGVDIGGEG